MDERSSLLYGICLEDRSVDEINKSTVVPIGDGEVGDSADDDDEPSVADVADALSSWLVGVAFGRFDPRLVTGERAIPPEPEPFDALSPCSPGMWPREEAPSAAPDILVDDLGHAQDIAAHVSSAASRAGLNEILDPRRWLAREFFQLHIKMYSKSRRKAPIYWQLATPSASYSVWLYIHAFTKDTFFRVQSDYVAPKLAHEERQLETLRAEVGPSPPPLSARPSRRRKFSSRSCAPSSTR